MKTTAAILEELGEPLVVDEIEIPDPEPGQVIVELAYSGVCHTQILEARGHRGEDPYIPHCLGHEGTGVVRETGEKVTRVEPGDRVLLSWMKGPGQDVLGSEYKRRGEVINAGGITTFMEKALISENRLTPLPEAISLKRAPLLGCAVPTGCGTVFNTLAPRPGEGLVVFGTGGIGLFAVQAAKIAGCHPIYGVDVNPDKLELADQLGATTTIDATACDPVEELTETDKLQPTYAVEASGRPEVMRQALKSVRSQGGKTAVVGNAHHDEALEIDPGQLNEGKQLLGTWGGDNEPAKDFSRYFNLLQAGKLNLDPFLEAEYRLAEINRALDDLEAGKALRPIIKINPELK